MDSKVADITRLFQKFKTAYEKDDLDTGDSILSHLKVKLTGLPGLPPLFKSSPTVVQELLARDVFEHAVALSMKMEDQDAFERHFLQQSRITLILGDLIPPFELEIAEFHTVLEFLPLVDHNHTCLKHAVELEQSFMDCAYYRVLSARQDVPHETYVYSMDLLAKTVRVYLQKAKELAPCKEIPSLQLINQTLGYGRELERTV